MNVEITDNWLLFEANETTAKRLDAVWVASKKKWKLPNTLGALRELHRSGYEVASYGKQKASKREKRLQMKNTPFHIEGLRAYQGMDINFLCSLPHAAIFNQQRTGKTPTTLKLIEIQKFARIIVICPASLVSNWKKEVETWTHYSAIAVKGSKKQRAKLYQEWNEKEGFLVLSKDTARADADHLSLFKSDILVVDEAHFLRNYQTAQFKAVFKLGKKAKKRLALTGTPAMNGAHDVWGILHFLYPDKFPSYWQFIERYFETWSTPWGSKEIRNPKRKEELQEILELISVQRKRSEVMQWVPAKQHQTFEVEMSKKQNKAYQDMLNLFCVEQDGDIKVDAPSILAQLTRLRQICLSPSLFDIEAPSAKEQFILEWLEDNPEEQVIIFSNYSSYLKLLASKVKGSRLIIGETPKLNRQNIVDEFQAGQCSVILANIQAAGTGLTLDKASTVIFLDRDYVPANNEQAEDRIVPTTEDSNPDCTVIDVVCKNSIDEKINSILNHKKNIVKLVNNYRNIKELLDKN